MGNAALYSHKKYQKNIELVKVKKGSSDFFKRQVLITTLKKKYGNTKADSDISSFLIKEIVTKAEIIWTLKTVMSAFSLGFRDSLSNCFQEMFLESKYPQNLLALAEQSFPIYKHMTFFHIFFQF